MRIVWWFVDAGFHGSILTTHDKDACCSFRFWRNLIAFWPVDDLWRRGGTGGKAKAFFICGNLPCGGHSGHVNLVSVLFDLSPNVDGLCTNLKLDLVCH